MKKYVEGSWAMAEAAALCRPGVVAAYPITPQTHIVEHLAEFVADGTLKAESVNVESEHSAASLVLGSQAAGVRSFTCTSSQGLLYMSEVVFCIAGMRLPVTMICANRAISAPINIWNDQQDSFTQRDAGWIQVFAENNQECVDLLIAGTKIAEKSNIMLPLMVCVDGFILTHGYETIDMPTQEEVDAYLPAYNPPYKLDVDDPMSFGLLGVPEVYTENRFALHATLESVLGELEKEAPIFKKAFGRDSIRLIEEYQTADAETIIVALGSVCGTIKDTIDEERAKGKKVGLLKIVAYRPFPADAIAKAVSKAKNIAVLDRNISLGATGAVYTEVKAVASANTKVSGFVAGLGGRDITKDTICEILGKASSGVSCEFIGVNEALLTKEFKAA
jgi:pyruvate ferredoxin oxidoreductase alpha subunit